MFIFSIRASSLKFIAAVVISMAVLAAMIIIIPENGGEIIASGNINYDSVSNEADAVRFLTELGWQVNSSPIETEEVTIPDEFDTVFLNYNQIQKTQGLDLSAYKRKTVTRYTFTVTNYDGYEGEVYANVIIYRGRVIGGDICSANPEGFVHGFEKPADSAMEQ